MHQLKSTFCLYTKDTSMHYIQKHQVLDDRLPGLLLQTAFYRCCETTRVHFMVLGGINRTAWGTRLLLMPVLASFVDCISLCHTLKAQHCSSSLNGCFNQPSAFHPPPIDSIRNITGTEKTICKISCIQVAIACRISYKLIAI